MSKTGDLSPAPMSKASRLATLMARSVSPVVGRKQAYQQAESRMRHIDALFRYVEAPFVPSCRGDAVSPLANQIWEDYNLTQAEPTGDESPLVTIC